jgi:hypothetical protein
LTSCSKQRVSEGLEVNSEKRVNFSGGEVNGLGAGGVVEGGVLEGEFVGRGEGVSGRTCDFEASAVLLEDVPRLILKVGVDARQLRHRFRTFRL